MKKFLLFTTVSLLISLSTQLKAQETPPPPPPPVPEVAPPPPPPPPLSENKQTEEIIIKKKGNKDVTLNIQISDDKVLINGKPLLEFNEDGVSISQKKVMVKEGNRITLLEDSDNPVTFNFGKSFGDDDFNEKVTFLGVSTVADKNGALIKEVTKDSPAEKAGLQKGDIITKVGSDEIASPDDLSKSIKALQPNEKVKILFRRDGKKKSTKATLAERPSPTMVYGFSGPGGNYRKLIIPPAIPKGNYGFGENWNNQFPGNGAFNFLADSLQVQRRFMYNSNRKKLGLKIQDTEDESGVKVLDVEDSSAAQIAGIQKDDIITQIGGNKVTNTDEVRYQLAENREKSAYNIKANRKGKEMSFDIKFPKKLKTANL